MGLFDFIRREPKPSASARRSGNPSAPPTTANDLARQIAQDTVRQLVVLEKVDLDFTPMSLTIVEQILDRCSTRGMRSTNQEGLVIGLGCYFGEVARRHAGARWVHHKDTPIAHVPAYPPEFLHLAVPMSEGDQYINVFKKITARLDGDRAASITGYYKIVTTRDMTKASAERAKPA